MILDNLPAHKGAKAREVVEATGARLPFLTPYSPDFNPIENAFANSPPASPKGCACRSLKPAPLKALLRKAAARTVDDLWRVIGQALQAFTPSECANYFAAAGYDAW